MSEFNVCVHVFSFNISLKINRATRNKNNDISRKTTNEERIKEAVENRIYPLVNYNDFNNLF